MNLTVELEVEMTPGRSPWWVAHTNRFHYPNWNGTAVGEGRTPTTALAALSAELEQIAKGAIVEPEAPLRADLERVKEES